MNLYMYQGNWKCSGCGGAITELPFQPRGEAGLTCRACYAKSKGIVARPAPNAPAFATASEPSPFDIPDDAGFASEAPPPFEGMDDAVAVTPGEKPRFSGNWDCAGCGAAITSLPFQPRDTSNLKCLDCFKASRG
jgi:CxxC-x17-CxxC domain-containing protein